MKNLLLAFLGIALTGSLALPVQATDDKPDSLKALASKRGILLGANFAGLVHGKAPNNWDVGTVVRMEQALAVEHFAILSAGWDMYPGYSWTGPKQYQFRGVDTFIDWCRERQIQVHGHGLGYGVRVNWLNKLPANTDAEKAQMRELYEGYVRDTVKHFAGRVQVWDVCNEQLLPAYTFAGFQTRQPYWRAYQANARDLASGVEWYRRTFRLAHEIDPKAKLILLEFNNEVICPKSDFLYKLVKQLLADRVPVHGVGFQMHLHTDLNRSKGHGLASDDDYFRSLTENLRRFSELGIELWITELDVSIDPKKEVRAELDRQAMIYGRVMEIALATRKVRGIKFWGIVDRNPWGEVLPRRPFLFNEDGKPKPAFHAVRKALAAPGAR